MAFSCLSTPWALLSAHSSTPAPASGPSWTPDSYPPAQHLRSAVHPQIRGNKAEFLSSPKPTYQGFPISGNGGSIFLAAPATVLESLGTHALACTAPARPLCVHTHPDSSTPQPLLALPGPQPVPAGDYLQGPCWVLPPWWAHSPAPKGVLLTSKLWPGTHAESTHLLRQHQPPTR